MKIFVARFEIKDYRGSELWIGDAWPREELTRQLVLNHVCTLNFCSRILPICLVAPLSFCLVINNLIDRAGILVN